MKDSYKFDERQLWIRGNVYKHILLLMGGLLLINSFLNALGFLWVSNVFASILILVFSIMVGSIEMICKEVYSGTGPKAMSKQKLMVYSFGIYSGISIISLTIKFILKKEMLIANNQLTDSAGIALMNFFLFIIFIIFVIKSRPHYKNQ